MKNAVGRAASDRAGKIRRASVALSPLPVTNFSHLITPLPMQYRTRLAWPVFGFFELQLNRPVLFVSLSAIAAGGCDRAMGREVPR
jgi:hypothetical protein